MDPIDLSHIESPRFAYTVKTADGSLLTKSLDFDACVVDLSGRIPTAFSACGEPDKNGNLKNGFQVVVEALQERKPIPESLPSIGHIVDATKKTFGLPDDIGLRVAMAVLGAFLEKMLEVQGIKKNGAVSPESLADIPASSDSSTSPPPSEANS